MIDKQETYSEIQLLESGEIQLRKTTKLVEDGNILSQSHHRLVLNPGDDVSDLPDHIQDISTIFWTDEMIEAFRDKQGLG